MKLYTETHEWINIQDNIATIGITDFAQAELGDIVYIELPKLNAQISKGAEVVVLESTKAAVDVYTPLSGSIVEVNAALKEKPETINKDPEKGGWLYKLKLSNVEETKGLMDDTAYKAFLKK